MKCRSIIPMGFLVLFEVCACLHAQPASFTHPVESLELVRPIVPEPIDLQAILAEDEQRDQYGGPYRFGVARPVQVTPQTDGVWEEIDEETLLWRLPIASPGAVCLSLGFGRFFMPPHASLYIYTSDESQVRGPFTQKDNAEHGELWTPLLRSDAIVVELTIPVSEVPQLELELTSINHGYRGFDADWALFGLGDSLRCNVDVACKEGDPWRDQIRSVAWYTLVSEGYQVWCSGSLVNNTAADDTPYFLTAFHCFDPVRDLRIADPNGAARTMVVYWNYEAATCGGTWASDSQNQSGATFRAAYWASDFALVELGSRPPASYNVYYAGWDRRETVPSSGAAIHHPRSDLKKISIENDPLSLIRLVPPEADFGIYFNVNRWDRGLTEHGSSGCPFFNSDKRVVGQFLGFPAEPTCANVQPNYFGPLYRSWNEGATPDTRLSDWLDRNNTGLTFVDGKNPGGPHGAQTEYASADVPKDIWSNMSVFSTLAIPEAGEIADLDVKLDITHSWDADLSVYLWPPSSFGLRRIQLFSNIGNGQNDFHDTILDDEASKSITQGWAPFTGSYRPVEPLNVLYGGNRAGTWKLEIADEVGGDEGILHSWSLIIGNKASGAEYPSSDVPKDILDNSTAISTIVITDTGKIADLDIKLDITHSWDADLSVYLRPPPGLLPFRPWDPDAPLLLDDRIELFTSVGNSEDDFRGTVLDDEASQSITEGSAPFAGSYRPVGKLSTLYGSSIAGTWTLEITDHSGGDTGRLNSWSLIIEKAP